MTRARPRPDDKSLRVAIGLRLAMLRKASGLGQSDIARACELSTSTVSRIESGTQFLTLPHLFRLAAFFGVPPGKLLPDLEDLHNAGYKGKP